MENSKGGLISSILEKKGKDTYVGFIENKINFMVAKCKNRLLTVELY